MDSRLLQLADSAFPSGAFTHSFGFEALRQLAQLSGEVELLTRLRELCWQCAMSALPFFNAAFDGADVLEVDARNEVYLSNHVARKASSAQGKAFLLATQAMLQGHPAVLRLDELREQLVHAHVAPAMGASFAAIGLSRADARQLFLFAAVRGALSALVRLGAVGPLRAQQVFFTLHPTLELVLERTAGLGVDDAASVAPVLELAQTAHDRLYSRLFQS